MKTVKLREVSEWYNVDTGDRINVSTFSIPTGYNPEKHKTRLTGIWGWYNINSGTYHSNPKMATSKEDVKSKLIASGYNIVD